MKYSKFLTPRLPANIVNRTFKMYNKITYRILLRKIVKKLFCLRAGFYEPVKINKKLYNNNKRDWENRWEAIQNEIINYDASSVLDIGCAEGWFIRLAAEKLNCFALGIDTKNKNILPGEIARLHDQVEFCASMEGTITPSTIEKIPHFDVVLCLSVVHHIIRKDGYERGVDFVKSIANKTTKAIIFEMGTSDEKK